MKIINKQGAEWDISEIVEGVTWKTSRIGRAGSLNFNLIKGAPLYQLKDFTYSNGDVVRLRVGNTDVFHGYIFSIDGGRDESVKITAYDQMRYLMNSDSYVFTGVTATEVLKRIAKDFEIKLGTVADTGYKIKTMSETGQKLMDIICKAITLTFANTGRDYCLYDDFGSLCLRDVNDGQPDLIIGDGSLMTDYSVKTSIDNDTYNYIKLYKNNQQTGKRELYVAKDTVNIKRWGLLQLYQSVDENANDAQIDELLSNLSFIKNRESKSLKINALGDIRVRAGMRVRILVSEYGVDQALLVDECTHDFDGADHTMTLDLRVV
ncbi:XkdQ/YqbQ family protein [Paenibacillus pinisoli]|uniref:XkdQ/YqbQ family protein n=1 Tax=Paenibacillus pinisoli TaxID=1276110 RepID=UPI00311E8516